MAGIYCDTCKCKVMIEQDGKRCSNCGMILIGAGAGKKPAKATPQAHTPDETLPAPRDVMAMQDALSAKAADRQADAAEEQAESIEHTRTTRDPEPAKKARRK